VEQDQYITPRAKEYVISLYKFLAFHKGKWNEAYGKINLKDRLASTYKTVVRPFKGNW